MVLDETILSLSAGGGGMRMSRGGRGGNRRRMMRRVMSLCRGGSGCSGSKYGTGGRGSLGREWRDHRCGYRGGLLTRQHRRCNTYTPVPINCFSIAKRKKKKNKRKREEKKKKKDTNVISTIGNEDRVHSRRRGSRDTFGFAFRDRYNSTRAPPLSLPSLHRIARAQCSITGVSRYSTAQV